ncbi:hypothetical protein NDU88_003785 [Pleurodeles waltl]|uniref:Uncharacterized protein n=1 Tax=Pleurodeles waltl TaxID=8319 RepID=A0AAV7TPE0_PLEWA|nr:hypothetical protein NDU88_003785 [Pleurodeles waltl]
MRTKAPRLAEGRSSRLDQRSVFTTSRRSRPVDFSCLRTKIGTWARQLALLLPRCLLSPAPDFCTFHCGDQGFLQCLSMEDLISQLLFPLQVTHSRPSAGSARATDQDNSRQADTLPGRRYNARLHPHARLCTLLSGSGGSSPPPLGRSRGVGDLARSNQVFGLSSPRTELSRVAGETRCFLLSRCSLLAGVYSAFIRRVSAHWGLS